MNKTIRRLYLAPECMCADIDTEGLLCQMSQFDTDDPEEMDDDDYAGVKGYRIFDNAFPD